jgi:hypothetical protein
MTFEFTSREPGIVPSLREVVFQALGAASVCWDDIEKAGVFQSEKAKEIGDALVAWIEEYYP